MTIVSLVDFLADQEFFIQEAKAGKIFIYPTDTIYGIGGIYTPQMVNKIFAIKHRDTKKMFSIIAPSFDRIMRNYVSTNEHITGAQANTLHEVHNHDITIDILRRYLDNYHGVTYIFDYTKPGVRIIKHPFQSFVQALGKAFITTSCNISGEAPLNNLNDLSSDLKSSVDYIIDGGILGGKPSVLIDLVENKIIER